MWLEDCAGSWGAQRGEGRDATGSGNIFRHGQAPSLKHCLEMPNYFYLGSLERPELSRVSPNDSALEVSCLQIGGVNIPLSQFQSILQIMFLSDSKVVTIGIHNIKKHDFFPFFSMRFFFV